MSEENEQINEESSDNSEAIAAAIAEQNNARVAALNAIGNNNDQFRSEELMDVNDAGNTEPFVAEQQYIADENAPAPDEVPVEEPVVAQPVSPPDMVTFKVNGIERLMPLSEVIARAQKIEAADQYLAEAARLRNQALQSPPKDAISVEDEDLALARAIQMGDEVEAVAAIRKLRSTGPSKDDLTKTIDERLTFNDAIAKFRDDYKDIVNDPYLNKMAMDTDTQMIANGDRRPYEVRYREIGDNLRGWVSKFRGEEVKPMTKQERKASAPAVPKAAAGKTVTTVEEEKEESAADIIAGIASQRGGPQWMSGLKH